MYEFLNGKLSYFFAGALNKTTNEFFYDKDILKLHSYVNEKREIDKRIKRGLKTFVDSGAFSAMTRGIEINIDDYIDYLNKNEEYFYLYCQFDTIPFENITGEESAKKTIDNYYYMRSRLKNPDKLLYCFHCGEPFEYLENILNNDDQVKYIALGGVAKKKKSTRIEFLNKAFEVIKNSKNPNVKVHGFGIGDLDIITKYPFTSVDSTTWIWYGAFGSVFYEGNRVPVSERMKDNKKYYENLNKEKYDKFMKEIESHGFKIEDISKTPTVRHIVNILQIHNYLKKMEENNV